jgi:LysR family transcriptional regulator, hydrogen peroxide-inducible genes activator
MNTSHYPLPSLKQLKYLIALAKHLNFTKAAQVCFVSQSTLSTGIKELESQLNVQLVERGCQQIKLTPVGQQIVVKAQKIFYSVEELHDLTHTFEQPMQKRMRFGIIPSIAPFILPKLMADLHANYHNVQLALKEDLSHRLLQKLHARELDFVLMALPYRLDSLDNIHITELYDDVFYLLAKDNDPCLQDSQGILTDAIADKLILLEEGHCLREHTIKACMNYEPKPYMHNHIEASSLLTLVEMVACGMGVSLIPEMALHSGLIQHTSLHIQTIKNAQQQTPKRTIALLSRTGSPYLQEFNIIADTLQRIKHA